MEEEGGARKSPRRSPRMRGQVSSPTDEVNDCPNFSLGISQVSGEQNKGEQNKEQNKKQNKGKKRVKEVNNVKKSKKRCVDLASTSKKIVDCDNDFEDLLPQFQSKKMKNKDGSEKKKPVKDAKTRNRLPKNGILPESRYPFENIVASEDEVSKFRLPEPRDYNAEILKLEPKGSSHEEDVAGIAIEKVLSEVVADINVQEVADVNTVGAQPYDATEDCQKPLHTLDDFIFLDEDLSQINRTEESYIKKRVPVDQNKKKVTPKKRGRKKNPGTSPYTQHFESGGTLCVTRQFFETKHPFSYATGGDNESDLIDSFIKWLYMGTKKR
uniref:Ulp1 protease family, C-terminal catalytic domain containing protein n=1 Tax=Solanum tuberosum TaxID=4113 RepID=M1AAZ6_SOLTU